MSYKQQAIQALKDITINLLATDKDVSYTDIVNYLGINE